jgi:hypothetical protein
MQPDGRMELLRPKGGGTYPTRESRRRRRTVPRTLFGRDGLIAGLSAEHRATTMGRPRSDSGHVKAACRFRGRGGRVDGAPLHWASGRSSTPPPRLGSVSCEERTKAGCQGAVRPERLSGGPVGGALKAIGFSSQSGSGGQNSHRRDLLGNPTEAWGFAPVSDLTRQRLTERVE